MPATWLHSNLAQSASAVPQHMRDLFVLLAIMAAILGIGTLVSLLIYRHFHRPDGDREPPTGFTLGDLRRLHRDGELNDEEYERAKARLIAGVYHDTAADADEEPDLEQDIALDLESQPPQATDNPPGATDNSPPGT
ncbi:MAG: SHOCT domain-containing protein [Phycisphaeraceae bacterium]